jgi:putative salt-induced outer membrane protein YdiY
MKVTAAIVIGVVGLLLLATSAPAEEKKLKNEAELSYVQIDGNTDVTTLSFKNQLDYQIAERLKSAWKLGVLYGESEGEQTAESYMTELRTDYTLKKKFYLYAITGYLNDEFAGIENRYYGGLGTGYHILDGPKNFLSGELGLNYSKEEYINDTDQTFTEGRAFVLYEYAIGEHSRFSQGVEYLFDLTYNENYRLNSDTAVKVQINTILSLKVGYEVRYDNTPTPETLDETDTRFYTAIVASI